MTVTMLNKQQQTTRRTKMGNNFFFFSVVVFLGVVTDRVVDVFSLHGAVGATRRPSTPSSHSPLPTLRRKDRGESLSSPFVPAATRRRNGRNNISINDHDDDDGVSSSSASASGSESSSWMSSRDVFLSRLFVLTTSTRTAVSAAAAGTTTSVFPQLALTPCHAFDGGVGGLGKTKPQTGVVLWDESSPPTQYDRRNNNGLVTTEIQSASSGGKNGRITKPKPIRVAFESPSYPLSATSGGLEVRDVRSTESGYVFVLPISPGNINSNSNNFKVLDDPKSFRDVLIGTVFSSQGKDGAYSSPTDITVKKLVLPTTTTATNTNTSGGDSSNGGNDTATAAASGQQQQQRRSFSVTFTTLTPAMRESLRQVWIVAQPVYDDTIVCFIVGTTKAKFDENKSTFERMIDSFVAVEAPPSSLRRSSVSSSLSSS